MNRLQRITCILLVILLALGLGTMMITVNEESVRTIQGALELGVTMFDTADIYGEFVQQRFGGNEKLVGRALKGQREKAIIATKFGITHGQGPKGDPAYIKKSVDASLFYLGIDSIDLYYQHRVDPNTPIEETVGTLGDLVKEGKNQHPIYSLKAVNKFNCQLFHGGLSWLIKKQDISNDS
ncbi:aldo/keto reductase [Paenibacillaceae bacterium]|nr:aldo/keto reductase [Paenibacillaceae bacterium]